MRTVLIPTDFSENALQALTYAQEIFKCTRAIFYLLHAYDDNLYVDSEKSTPKDRKRKSQELYKRTMESLKVVVEQAEGLPPNPKHSFETIASSDSLVDAVNDAVNRLNVDIVVMGTKGGTSDNKTIFGSYTIQVFKYVVCPVLAIPGKVEFKPPKRILFPTDYMVPYKRRELKLLGELAGQFKSEIHFLYLSDFDVLSNRQVDNKLFLKGTLDKAYLFFETAKTQHKVNAILECIAKKEMDMLTMVNSRHSFFEDMLYRSSVDELGMKVKIPFLVMQNLPR